MIRPVLLHDAEQTATLVTPDVAENLLSWRSPMSVDEARDRILESARLRSERAAVDYALTLRKTGELTGWLGLKLTGDEVARLGYWLGTAFRNRGLMKEAVGAAVPAGARFLQVRFVEALVLPDNRSSVALLDGAGFQKISANSVQVHIGGGTRWCDEYRLEIERDLTD